MPDTPLRGRRGRDRRIAERVATDFAARHALVSPDDEVDFDVAAVDAEVEDARRLPPKKRPPNEDAEAGEPRASARGRGARRARKPGGHRLPDLSALPPLLAATGTFAGLRERLGTRRGRPA